MKNAILIVDDSRLNRETLAAILKDKYNIIEAEDGRSGLEILEKRKDDIVLVILDIVMPGMDGFAFMEEARTRESIRNIPIVVATTETDYQTEKRCLELGVWDFIPKVFRSDRNILAGRGKLRICKADAEKRLCEASAKTQVEKRFTKNKECAFLHILYFFA